MGTEDNKFLVVSEVERKLGTPIEINNNFADKNFCISVGADRSLLENRSNKEYPRNVEIQKVSIYCEISFNTDTGVHQFIEIYNNQTIE